MGGFMIVLFVIVGIIIVSAGLGALYDRRARRRGWRVGVSIRETDQNRAEVAGRKVEPFIRHHDRELGDQ
jgi:hypothetical protein